MGIKDKIVPSFTCDWGAVAERPLRKRSPFVGSDVEGHMAWSYRIKGRAVKTTFLNNKKSNPNQTMKFMLH